MTSPETGSRSVPTSEKLVPEPTIYPFSDDGIRGITQVLLDAKPVKDNKGTEFYNIPVAFDIETSSFETMEHGRGVKRACMYIWTLAVRTHIIQGRTWGQFVEFCGHLADALGLGETRRLVVYVQNLGFEFQFLRKYFDWADVFSISEREPLIARTVSGIDFRCSYKLTNYSLATIAKNLTEWDVAKLTGDMDYSKIRHSGTPLTPEELRYCYNDVLILTCLIDERIHESGNITRIPLTATGYVRRHCRKRTLKAPGHGTNWTYYDLIHKLTLEQDQYRMLRSAFQGGFTHANAWYVERILEDVGTADLTSSYPAVLVRERFPVGAPEEIEVKTTKMFRESTMLYCCLFQAEFHNLRSTSLCEHPLSASKCYYHQGTVEDNGRVVQSDFLQTTITEQDYFIIKRFYEWDEMRVGRFLRFRRDYLPAEMINAVLDLYHDKTALKGVKGKEAEYQHLKELLNSVYGMTVTSIARPLFTYDSQTHTWGEREPDLRETLEQYNGARGRFLYYPWGVWVTAYARRALFSAISALGDDYIYSDTDSVYYLHPQAHQDYFDHYNQVNGDKLRIMCEARGIDPERTRPETIKGVRKQIGDWDVEPDPLRRFKTLGAKRYIKEDADGEIQLTVSGVDKRVAMPWMRRAFGPFVFEAFKASLNIPAGMSGKQTHTYIDVPTEGDVTDYRGVVGHYRELSSIHLEEAEYSFSIARQFREYLDGLRPLKDVHNYQIIGGSDNGGQTKVLFTQEHP